MARRSALCLALLLASCGGSGGEEPNADTTDEAQDVRVERLPIDPATTGVIRGVVLFDGEPPRRRELGMGAEKACGVHDTPPLEEHTLIEDGRIQNVYVSIRRGLEGWEIPAAAPAEAVLDQRGCLYSPHVLALRAGQRLVVRNSDALTHNVKFEAKRNNERGNVSMGPKGPELELRFDRREHLIPFECSLHPWMGAVVHVEDHPFFALSRADGTFAIEGVPPGEYELEAIHERLGKRRRTVLVGPGGSAEVSFTFD